MSIQYLFKFFVACAVIAGCAQNSVAQSVLSDQWAATDALGRKVRDYLSAGVKKRDKVVAMFYWTWHQGDDDTTYQVKNITEIVRKYPEAMKDYNHRAWGNKKPGFFFWEQPLLGYYKTTDPWVLRKHAEMLADAGVDAVFFDCTNGSITWNESYEALMKTWDQAQMDGVNVPKIAYMLPFGPVPNALVSLRQLYRDVYKPRRYEKLWFVWKGKPCIMGYPDSLTNSAEDKEIAGFFTFRPGQPDYVNGPSRNDQWGWLENYPQHGYVRDKNGKFEEVTVGVAQNASPSTNGHCSAFNLPGSYGRSFSKRNGFDPRVDGYLYGWNFQEQWDRAIELDPELVFITGWNEYIAGQWLPKDRWTGDPFSFVDEFDWDRSRDIEPNKGWSDKGDVYYLQLIDNVRKFKGMILPEKASVPKTIKIGKADGWADVAPDYRHYKGNTMHRDHRGRYDQYYTNNTGRNDIVGAKVARDAEKIYFYAETAEKLTPTGDRNWMMLLIDIDRDKSTGWNGYDFIVNRISPIGNKAIVEKNIGGSWEWEPSAEAKFAVRNNKLELEIKRSVLNLIGKEIDIEFKWNDNMQENGNIMDFYVNGDAAPGGRFNFIYTTGNSADDNRERDSKFKIPPLGASDKQPGTDFAPASQRQAWLRHPVLGDPSFDNFKRYDKNPVQRGNPPFNWPVNGFYFEDPVSGNEYIFAGQYRTGYAMSTDKMSLDLNKGCVVYYSEDTGKNWKFKGPAFNEEVVMLEQQAGPVTFAPDVSVVYSDGKYYMGLDYVTTGFSWDIKNLMNGGLAVAVSDKPEGPYKIFSKPAITNGFFYYKPWLGKYNRCYAGTLIKAKDQWVFLFDLDSGTYYSWALAAISAPAPEGPWSKPAILISCESDIYHPSLMEYFPVFLHNDTLYSPATSVARNRNFQCIFRAPANEAMNPEKWELWQEGSVWHSIHAENEYEGIWGQTFSGFINKADVLKVMYPSRDKENRGTINLASVDWKNLHRDSGFVLSGHGAASFTAIPEFYSQPDIESSFSYYGTVAFVWNYRAPVGPDRPKADAELHPLMYTSNTRFQLTETRWFLLNASVDGPTDTISRGLLDKSERYSLKIEHRDENTIISIDNKVLWQGSLNNSDYGRCGLFAMRRSGIDVRSFIVSGRNHPGFMNWLYTEGLSNSGSDLKDWEIFENSSWFTYGIGAVSKIDTALAKWSFTGSGFDLYCPKMPALGKAEIIVNGSITGEIDLHSDTPEKSEVVYSMRGLTQKKNAIIIRGKNGKISLDCLRVYD